MNDILDTSSLVDEYATVRDSRLALKRQVDKLEEQEKKLKAQIIASLIASNATAIGGRFMIVTLVAKTKPVAKVWAELYAYIKETDGWDLLQKRLTETAVALRWDEGIIVPGVEKFPVNDLSLSKR
jgi:hypothetical protein